MTSSINAADRVGVCKLTDCVGASCRQRVKRFPAGFSILRCLGLMCRSAIASERFLSIWVSIRANSQRLLLSPPSPEIKRDAFSFYLTNPGEEEKAKNRGFPSPRTYPCSFLFDVSLDVVSLHFCSFTGARTSCYSSDVARMGQVGIWTSCEDVHSRGDLSSRVSFHFFVCSFWYLRFGRRVSPPELRYLATPLRRNLGVSAAQLSITAKYERNPRVSV